MDPPGYPAGEHCFPWPATLSVLMSSVVPLAGAALRLCPVLTMAGMAGARHSQRPHHTPNSVGGLVGSRCR